MSSWDFGDAPLYSSNQRICSQRQNKELYLYNSIDALMTLFNHYKQRFAILVIYCLLCLYNVHISAFSLIAPRTGGNHDFYSGDRVRPSNSRHRGSAVFTRSTKITPATVKLKGISNSSNNASENQIIDFQSDSSRYGRGDMGTNEA